jgi:2-polyprenyl-3-methyl-5-hydroxy-6-metoxy-1,4-benzoquinol methylase
MIQTQADLDEWYQGEEDPWEYESSFDDLKRKKFLLECIPDWSFDKTLDIGCGNGFVTRDLPGEKIKGVDLSKKAIEFAQTDAKKRKIENIEYQVADIFDLNHVFDFQFNLIVITGVIYPQYIAESDRLIYIITDKLLAHGGILASVHIDEWYTSRFPYQLLRQKFYPYRHYQHRLEIYYKS